MEVGLHFEKGDGPMIDRPIRTEADLERIPDVDVAALGFVGDAIKLVHRALGATTPLIGFAGAPFTLASYLIEGGSSRQYQATKTFMYTQPETWHRLMELLARVTADYLKMQIAAGADIVQIFDSWVGSLGPDDYRRFVLPHTASVIAAIPADVPVIHFGTVTGNLLELMREAGGDVHRPRLARRSRRRVGAARTTASRCRAISIRSRCSPTLPKFADARARFSIRPADAPATSSISATEYCRRRRSITRSRWSTRSTR